MLAIRGRGIDKIKVYGLGRGREQRLDKVIYHFYVKIRNEI